MSRAARALSGLLLAIGIGITAITVYFIGYTCIWKALDLLDKSRQLSETLGSWSPVLVLMAIMAALGAILTKAGADLMGKIIEQRREVQRLPAPPPSTPPSTPPPPSARPTETTPPSITTPPTTPTPTRPPKPAWQPPPPPSLGVELPRELPREREVTREEEGPARLAFEVARRERLFPPPPSRPSKPTAEEAKPEEAPRGPERPELPPPPGRPTEARPGLSEDELNRILRILRERRRKT